MRLVFFLQADGRRDSLNSSTDDSCPEDIDNSDDSAHSPSEQAPSSEDLARTFNKSDGIVLQFAPDCNTAKQKENEKCTPLPVEWNTANPLHRQATRSLSAVRRKEAKSSSIDGGQGSAMEDVLQALKMENESVTNLCKSSPSGEVEWSTAAEVGSKSTLTERNAPFGDQNEAKESSQLTPPRMKKPLLPSLPFKPVLVSRYRSGDPPAMSHPAICPPAMTQQAGRAEGNGRNTILHQDHQPSSECSSTGHTTLSLASQTARDKLDRNNGAPSQCLEGSPLDVVGGEGGREATTEHTVKIITEKVRQMDARYVSQCWRDCCIRST